MFIAACQAITAGAYFRACERHFPRGKFSWAGGRRSVGAAPSPSANTLVVQTVREIDAAMIVKSRSPFSRIYWVKEPHRTRFALKRMLAVFTQIANEGEKTVSIGRGRECSDTQLRVFVESLGAVIQPVLDKRCAFAVSGVVPLFSPELELEQLLSLRLTLVAGPTHPLLQLPGPLSSKQLAEHVQLVLTDRSTFSEGRQFGVIAQKTWRLADLGAKHSFLKGGLGWGGMPIWMVQPDLAAGRLVELNVESTVWPESNQMTMYALHRRDSPPGPAGRWLIRRLRDHVMQCRAIDEANAGAP